MSSNDRRQGKFSRNSSPGEGRRKGSRSFDSRWEKSTKGNWDASRGSKKPSRNGEGPYRENSEGSTLQSRGIKNRRNSFSSKVSINSNERGRGVKDESSISYNEKRKVPYFSRNNQKSSLGNNKWPEQQDEKVVFESESDDIFWGRHSVQSILESARPIHRVWCTPEIRSSPRFLQLLKDAKSLGVLVEEVSWARLGHVTRGGVHQGIALQTAASETFDLKTLIEACRVMEEDPVLIALDGLTDPHNLGAIVRSAEALGAHGMVLPQRRTAGITGSVAKVAAGALEHLPVARVINLNRSLEELKKAGYTIVGLAGEGAKTVNEIPFDGPLVLVIGSEGKGLSLLTRRHCDILLRIPLRGVTSSLNASVATSVVLYEVARQGWMKGLSGQAPSPKMVRAKLTTKPLEGK